MNRGLPATTLICYLVAALAVSLGGWWLSREEIVQRLDRDREAHRHLIVRVHDELDRLETLYHHHLTRLTQPRWVKDAFSLRLLAEDLVGVTQVAILPRYKGRPPEYLLIADEAASLPAPILEDREAPFGRQTCVLTEAEIDAQPEGWVDEPGLPLMYWASHPNAVVVVTVDRRAVGEAINAWLIDWLKITFDPLRVLAGPDRFEMLGGPMLAGVGLDDVTLNRRPDQVLPVQGRYGTWQLVSWDGLSVTVHERVSVLMGAGGLALVLLLLGFVSYTHQQKAMKLAEQRVSFVNQVSHELRTPLTNILLNVDLVAEAAGESDAEAQKRLALIQEETNRLGRLVSNVLTFAGKEKAENRLSLEACVPDEVVREVLQQFRPALERKGMLIRYDQSVTTSCLMPRDALVQVLANLISNAEKYAADGGMVEVSCSMAANQLIVRVADNGPGIPPRERERVFEPFHRLSDRVTEGASGTGLGLAISKTLVERMKGRIRLLPSVHGAVFELEVPIVPVGTPHLS